MGSSGVVKNRKRKISIFAAIVCLRNGGWKKLRGRCATKQEKGLSRLGSGLIGGQRVEGKILHKITWL